MSRELHEVLAAAHRVVSNAFGTKPRHTKARGGQECRDDCIPCGIERLKLSLSAYEKMTMKGGGVNDD